MTRSSLLMMLMTSEDDTVTLPAQVSGAEITAGTETALRSYSPADITAFVAQHESPTPVLSVDGKTGSLTTGVPVYLSIYDNAGATAMTTSTEVNVGANLPQMAFVYSSNITSIRLILGSQTSIANTAACSVWFSTDQVNWTLWIADNVTITTGATGQKLYMGNDVPAASWSNTPTAGVRYVKVTARGTTGDSTTLRHVQLLMTMTATN